MDEFNTVNDVEVVTEGLQDDASESITEETPVEPVVENAPQQSKEDNASYAAARRQAEAESRAIKMQNDRLVQALQKYGYEGSPEEMADALEAANLGTSVEEVKAEREAREAEDAKLNALKSENEYYRNIAIKSQMAEDLKQLQTVYPEVKSLNELDPKVFAIMKNGLDVLTAYEVLKTQADRNKKPTPPEIGGVDSSSSQEKDFYSPSEVDKLTSKDYDNPKIMERVRNSMLKWK